MSDMIERVAQAILAKDTEGVFSIHYARVYAKAAIAAMREPTGSMYMAGGIVSPSAHLADKDYKPYGTRTIGDMAAKVAWEKMIDAALEEK
jgi:hypothetical protein